MSDDARDGFLTQLDVEIANPDGAHSRPLITKLMQIRVQSVILPVLFNGDGIEPALTGTIWASIFRFPHVY